MPSTQPAGTEDKLALLRVPLYFSLYSCLIFTGLPDAGPDTHMAQVTVSGSLVPESSCLDYMTRLWVFSSRAHEGCEGSNSRSRIRRLRLGHSSGLGQSGWRQHQGGGGLPPAAARGRLISNLLPFLPSLSCPPRPCLTTTCGFVWALRGFVPMSTPSPALPFVFNLST